MHPVISEVIRETKNIVFKNHKNMVEKSINLSMIDESIYDISFDKALSFLVFLYSIKENLKENVEGIALLCKHIGNLEYQNGNYKQATKNYFDAKKIYDRIKGKYNSESLEILSNVAHSLEKLGKFNKAERVYKLILPLFKDGSNVQMQDFIIVINNMAVNYYYLNKFDEMQKNILFAIKMWRNVKTINFDRATSYEIMSQYYYKNNEIMKAITNIKKAIKFGIKINRDHPRLIAMYSDLATYYSEIGNNEKALRKYILGVNLAKQNHKEHHYHTLILQNNIGYTYEILDKYVEANDCYIEAAYWQLKKMGINHHFSKILLANIQRNYVKLGKNLNDYQNWLNEQIINYSNSLSGDLVVINNEKSRL